MKRLLLLFIVACGLPEGAQSPASARALTVREVTWNPTHAPTGVIVDVADVGSDVVLFGEGTATILEDGNVVAVDRSVTKWQSSATIPAPDGTGSWIVGVDGDGVLRRLRARKAFEKVSERYGLGGARVRRVAALGGPYVAFLLDAGMAVADGSAVSRYPTTSSPAVAGGGFHGALYGADEVRVFDAVKGASKRFAVDGARWVAVDADGHVVVASSSAIWVEGKDGALELRYRANGDTLHGLAFARDRVWFADGAELGTLEASGVALTHGLALAPTARLTASPTGDVWALAAGNARRFAASSGGETTLTAAGPSGGAPAPSWQEAIAPVFARACASCHGSSASSGIALGDRTAWQTRKDLIRQRVLVERSMPPAGASITDADRAAIARWLDTGAK